jgi:hypothetical protein
MSASPCIKAATGHWFDILTGPGGVDPALLDGKPRACPICGEGTDRFTFDDKDGRGTWICRQCPARPGKGAGAGDGVALLEAVTGWDFRRAAAEVEQFLGLPPQGASNGHRQASPAVAPIRRQVAPPPPPAALPAVPQGPITLLRLPGVPNDVVRLAPSEPETETRQFVMIREGADRREFKHFVEANYRYSCTQKADRLVPEIGGKKWFRPYFVEDGRWVPGGGLAPWPTWRQQEVLTAAEANPGQWVLETEGEKAAEIAREGGLAATSQPGHAHKVEQHIVPRYRRLQAGGVAGVVYLADEDIQGLRRAETALKAAAAVGLPLVVLPASTVWQQLPEGGSIDDGRGTPAERVAAIEKEISLLKPEEWRELWADFQKAMGVDPPTQQAVAIEAVPNRGAAIVPDGFSAAHALDGLLGPAEEGKLRRPRTDKLTQALGLILPLRYNLLTGRIEHNGQAIHGDFLGGLYLELAEEHQLDVTKDRAIDAAIRVARKNAYHPVRDYLNSITATLASEDWAAIDLRCFGREDHTGMAGLNLQRQLIGLVARAMQPGCELQTALVIHSDRQGIGKSSFWRILGGEWFSDSLGDLRNLKDDLLQLHAAWIHEWGEIDMVMGKQESEALKRFLSASRDDVRKPYGRGVETLQRSCGIVGTTNRRDFIKDPTGNRRFPIISIERANLDWVTANRHAIWGSAVAAYRNGTRWQYDGGENTLVSANALAFAPEDPLRERIETWAEDHPTVTVAPLEQILKEIDMATDDMAIRRQAGNALTTLGWTRSGDKQRFPLPWGGTTNATYGWRRTT